MIRKAALAIAVCLFLTAAIAGAAHAGDWQHRSRYGSAPWPAERSRCPGWDWWDPWSGCSYDYSYGYGYGCRYSWWSCLPDRSVYGSTLSLGEAKKLVQWVIRFSPSLQVGDVTEVKGGYEATIVTRKGKKLVDMIYIEEDTAYVYPNCPPGNGQPP